MSLLMKYIALLTVVLFISVYGLAQNIGGTVSGSDGKAVPYASVNLKNTTTSAIVGYSVTDTKGNYVLAMPVNARLQDLEIEVRCIGYTTTAKSIAGIQSPVNFILSASINQLQAVVVKSTRPLVRTNGDTLSYNVSKFSTAQDRVIGDVIKRLPGITVATDGTILYNNKPISNLYIGGDDLLGDRYNIATATVPQGVVDEVQVIENHQPIKVLKGKIMSTDVALNLTFKKGAKLHAAGQESIGAGLPGNYDVNLNAMMFKDKYKAINYLQGNNTGDELQQNLVAHNLNDFIQRIDNDVPAKLLSAGTINNPALSPGRYLFNQSGIINLNNLVNLKNNVQLKVNAWYYHDNQRQYYSQRTIIFLPGDTVHYNEIQRNRLQPDILHSQFTLNINRDKYYLNDVLMLDDNRQPGQSNLLTNGTTLNQAFKDNTLQVSNEFSLIKSFKSSRMFQVYSYISRTSEPESRTIGPSYNAPIFNDSIFYSQLVQNANVPTWFTNNYISFKIPSALFTQSFKTGFNVQSQTLTSALNVIQADNKITPESDSSVNHLNWLRKKVYAELDYDMQGSILKASLALPVSLQQVNYSDNNYALNKGLTRVYFNPQLNIKYQTGVEHYVSLQYSYRNHIGTVEDMYQGYILKDYRTLYANNATLLERRNQMADVAFNYRKALTLFFFSAHVSYNHTASNNISSEVITNNLLQQVVLPYPNNASSWAAGTAASKYFFKLKTTLGGGIQWQSSRSMQIQNNLLLPFNTITKVANISADTKVNDNINFSYKATLTQTFSRSAVMASAYHINQLMQQASVNYNPAERWQFKLSGEHYFTRQQGNPDLKYFFADASAKLRINKWRTDVELTAVNFLNVKAYNVLYLAANTFTSSSYTLPGRIVMLKFWFAL